MVKPLVHVPKVFILHAKEWLAGNLRFNVQGCLNTRCVQIQKRSPFQARRPFLYLTKDRQ